MHLVSQMAEDDILPEISNSSPNHSDRMLVREIQDLGLRSSKTIMREVRTSKEEEIMERQAPIRLRTSSDPCISNSRPGIPCPLGQHLRPARTLYQWRRQEQRAYTTDVTGGNKTVLPYRRTQPTVL